MKKLGKYYSVARFARRWWKADAQSFSN